MRHDVIVIGAGLAGHCASIEAARGGASVLLLEKTDNYGGSTAMSGGAFAFAGTRAQQAQGIADNPELLQRDMLAWGQHLNDPQLVRAYAEHQHSAYLWLE